MTQRLAGVGKEDWDVGPWQRVGTEAEASRKWGMWVGTCFGE